MARGRLIARDRVTNHPTTPTDQCNGQRVRHESIDEIGHRGGGVKSLAHGRAPKHADSDSVRIDVAAAIAADIDGKHRQQRWQDRHKEQSHSARQKTAHRETPSCCDCRKCDQQHDMGADRPGQRKRSLQPPADHGAVTGLRPRCASRDEAGAPDDPDEQRRSEQNRQTNTNDDRSNTRPRLFDFMPHAATLAIPCGGFPANKKAMLNAGSQALADGRAFILSNHATTFLLSATRGWPTTAPKSRKQ